MNPYFKTLLMTIVLLFPVRPGDSRELIEGEDFVHVTSDGGA